MQLISLDLGNMIDNEGSINTTIHDRIQIGNRVYYTNSILLRIRLLVVTQKLKYKDTYQIGCYCGGDTWTLTENEKETQRRFERNIVRHECGPFKEYDE